MELNRGFCQDKIIAKSTKIEELSRFTIFKEEEEVEEVSRIFSRCD
jgi:hypothetical protein